MEDYIVAEEYTLPSKGMVYSQKINPNFIFIRNPLSYKFMIIIINN